jgi:hypothetical protein
MNLVFQKLLKKPESFKPFIQYYASKYGTQSVSLFQELPFSHQLGVYLEYFESIYNLIVLVSTKGYRIQFTDNRKTPIRGENDMQYSHYKFNHTEPQGIMIGYEMAIEWLFDNYDLPF